MGEKPGPHLAGFSGALRDCLQLEGTSAGRSCEVGKSSQLAPSTGWDGGAGEQLAQGSGPCQVQTPGIVLLPRREEQRAELS